MKTILTSLLSLIGFVALAQSGTEITINGNFPKEAGKTITIIGAHHFKQTTTADASGSFKINYNGETGYYLITYTNGGYFIYAEPGTNLTIKKTDAEMGFSGVGSEQNNLINELAALKKKYFETKSSALPAQVANLEPTEFNTRVTDYRSASLKLLNSHNFGGFFNKTQTDYMEYAIKDYETYYLTYYGMDTAKEKAAMAILLERKPGVTSAEAMAKFTAAYATIHTKNLPTASRDQLYQDIWQNFDLNNAAMFFYSPHYSHLLDLRLTQLLNAVYAVSPYLRKNGLNEGKYDVIKKEITDPEIKQALLYKYMKLILSEDKNNSQYYNDYLTVATDEVYIADIKALYKKIGAYASGNPAPDFAYNDINGHKITLSSLKGSFVYIDVWAQWCGPCKAEIPFLKEIEKKYEGQNIKFVSLSIDKETDIDKWKKYIADNNLGGIQIIADKEWKSDFTQWFNVISIPRFILIDPNGKIVTANADRPSNPRLQTLFDKLLIKS